MAELKGEKATAAPSGGAPPPPAMAPPPPQFTLAPATDADAGLDRGALFAQINVGEDITKSRECWIITSSAEEGRQERPEEGPGEPGAEAAEGLDPAEAAGRQEAAPKVPPGKLVRCKTPFGC